MQANPDPRLVALYRRAVVCQTFPAYRLDDLTHLKAIPILQAMQLLDVARKVQSG